jgi:hypothetical protein
MNLKLNCDLAKIESSNYHNPNREICALLENVCEHDLMRQLIEVIPFIRMKKHYGIEESYIPSHEEVSGKLLLRGGAVSHIHHNINNPPSIALGNLEILKDTIGYNREITVIRNALNKINDYVKNGIKAE